MGTLRHRMQITRLDATLGAVVTGVSLAALTDTEWTEIERAFHEHAVLVFPAQHLSSAEQIAFARRFGSIESLADGYDAVPISTIDRTGDVMEPDHPVMQVIRGNQGWHTDSSYMPVSAKASMLSAKVVTKAGGETEWADMRAAYDALDDETRDRVRGLSAHHSIAYSQTKAGFGSAGGYGMDEAEQLRPLVKGPPGDGSASAVHRPARARHPVTERGGVGRAARGPPRARMPATARLPAPLGTG